MNNKQQEIELIQRFILEELKRVNELTDETEKLERASVLWKVNKVVANLDNLEPTLKKWFHKKEKEK